jgi:hypothetical protein
MKPSTKRLLSLSFLLLSTVLSAGEAHAIFNLSVSPRQGGQSIRFDESTPGKLLENEEVILTVTNTEGGQYNIYQTMYQPLTNEFGNVIPAGSFFEFSPSNPLGTLRSQMETPVSMGQMPIYTSNAAGESDQFVLVFNVRVPENQPGGTYRSRITFTADPVNPSAGSSPSVVTLDVAVELRPTFRMTVQSVKGGQEELNLGRISQNNLTAQGTLRVRIESNIGTTFRVIQQVVEPLSSPEGETLDDSAIVFRATGGQNGRIEIRQAEPLAAAPKIIYTSNESGQGDVFDILFQAASEDAQKAGIYTGSLMFKVESNSTLVTPEVITVRLRLEIEPIFYLDVQMKEGTSLHFGTFRSDTGEQNQTALVRVHSNLGEPYAVTQTIKKLTNSQGAVIPEEYFRYFGADAETGALASTAPTPIRDGEMVVYRSDAKGTPEEFTLNYLLSIPVDARGGNYNSDIKYSITTL